MSNLATIIYLEKVWELYQGRYTDWCVSNSLKADPSHFSVWLEDNDLMAEPYE